MPQVAYRFDAVVGPSGKMEVTVPVPDGVRVEVLVLAPAAPDTCSDLVEAAQSSLEFWNNPQDDADWNHA
jgi:hypothetical protein